MRFQINQPKVVCENFDDESVLVHFDTGAYYSVLGCGPEILKGLGAGEPVEAIVEHLVKSHGVAQKDVKAYVEEFIQELRQEDLIVALADGEVPLSIPVVGMKAASGFAPPHLERFTDLQDLLLLDPVHDVDTSGWPVAKTDAHAGK